ncbi:hypothetical protein HPB50_003617 [Hyalomma asiaticum]|uniref:Uncharacterized protein n=1 Tax=Hyalomma asiaticum TaxID=266040 RepID=A0ACB7RIR0_HYAAI|nr:hypothetical protein HPB50_003617 [Hyalomma asiaticum]
MGHIENRSPGNQELLPISLEARRDKTASNEQLHQSSLRIRTSFHNARSSLIRRDNTPEGVQALSGLDSRTSVGGVDATVARGRGLPQLSALRAGISGRQSVIQPDAWRKTHVLWPGTIPVPNSVGAQILREEAPIIRVIRTKINEGHEAERNLTAIRSAILQELSNANGIGIIRRIQIKNRLRELDTRINELRGKNEEAELKLRTFMDGVASEFAGGDEPFEETEDQETEEGAAEEDREEDEEDVMEGPGMREGRIQPRTGTEAYGRSLGIAVQSGQTILRGEHQVIHEIEVVLDLGRNLEKNLTSMREVVTKEMEKSRSGREVIQCKRKIARIDDILTQVQTRNDKAETQFRALVKRILSGEIPSKRRCHVLLHGLLSAYRTSLHGLARNSAGFLRSVVRGVSGALSHLGAGILDIFKLKFAPFEFAINAITNRG